VEFGRSAFRHGFGIDDIMHAIENAVVRVDLEPDSDPPKVLAVGVDRSGRWVEVIWLRFAEVDVVIHAMKLRKVFEKFLEGEPDE
jgi:hypothetical protein